MIERLPSGDASTSPPLEKGRSARAASRVGIRSRFDRSKLKTALARRLRSGSTGVEGKPWHKLRNGQIEGASFRRQHPAGPYVLDFYCSALRLAIELDGGQHAESVHASHDRKRDQWFAERGVTVLRFWNSDLIGNLDGVLEVIKTVVNERACHEIRPRWTLADGRIETAKTLP